LRDLQFNRELDHRPVATPHQLSQRHLFGQYFSWYSLNNRTLGNTFVIMAFGFLLPDVRAVKS